MEQTLVIGFGNEWRSDDALGPVVARQIDALRLPNVRVLVVHQLTPELAEIIAIEEQVFFVDACRIAQTEPIVITQVESEGASLHVTHVFDPRSLLALSRVLYNRTPRAWTVTIDGMDFSPGEGLSDLADQHAKMAVQQIVAMLNGL